MLTNAKTTVRSPKTQALVHAANFRAANCRLLKLTTRPPAISHSVIFFEFLSAWIETATVVAIAACEKSRMLSSGQDESGLQQADHQECGGPDQHAQQRKHAQ